MHTIHETFTDLQVFFFFGVGLLLGFGMGAAVVLMALGAL